MITFKVFPFPEQDFIKYCVLSFFPSLPYPNQPNGIKKRGSVNNFPILYV
jgi:hypothetical protein